MQTWKTISKRTVFNHSRWLTVEDHTVELPDGRTITEWPWLITPSYINVAALTTEGKFLCFWQPKYGVEGISLAPVGGYIDDHEDPRAAARRELLEETGYEAQSWIDLGSYTVDGNHGAGTAFLFLALGAEKKTERKADDLEEQQVLLLTPHEVQAALLDAQFKVLSWATLMALALIHLDKADKK